MRVAGSTSIMKNAKGYFSINEIKRILKLAREHDIKHYAILYTLYKTGRRISEVLKMKVSDIDFINNKICWTILKRKPAVSIWLKEDKDLIKLLHTLIDVNYMDKEERVFKYSRQRVYGFFRWYCKKAGIKASYGKYQTGKWKGKDIKPHLHMLRHSFSIHYIKSREGNLYDLMRLNFKLQHASFDNTRIYLQFGKKFMEEDKEFVPDLLKETMG